MGIGKEELTLDEWLSQTEILRADLYVYGKSPLPIERGPRHLDLDEAIYKSDSCGRLVADADSFVTQMTAQAVLRVKKEYPDNSADERKMLVKDAVREIQHIRDSLAITQRTIRDRIFTSLNANRSSL